jgi:hypothetical protein
MRQAARAKAIAGFDRERGTADWLALIDEQLSHKANGPEAG